MIAALVLVLAQGAPGWLASLERLSRYADQLQLRVTPGMLTDAETGALSRWPGLVEVELRLPLRKPEAAQLRKLKRLAVRVPRRDPSLALLGPALVRVELIQPEVPGVPEPVCSGTLRGEVLELKLLDACALRWLDERLAPHPETPEPPPRPR